MLNGLAALQWALRATLAALVLCTTVSAAHAQRRLAFVAGVNDYPNLPKEMQLQRAVQDAETVADTLRSLGFEVTRITKGATLTGLLSAFGTFTRAIEPGDTALFYFAGHGIALDNTNYLVPADIPPLAAGGESIVKKLALAEPDLIADIQAKGARVTLMVIDACRDNPFPKAGTRALGQTRGLSTREPPQGVFSLYSAGFGQKALDALPGNDPSPNSVFTRVFVSELKKPGVSLHDLGEIVREEVAELARRADHDQIPAVYNQVLGARRILLAGIAPPTPAPIVEPPRPPVPAGPGPDEIAWSFLERDGTAAEIEGWQRRFPTSALAGKAEARLRTLREEAERTRVAALERDAASRRQQVELEAERSRLADEARRKEADEAARKRAEAERVRLASLPGPAEIARRLKSELKRAGCEPGEADGEWTPRAQAALGRFIRSAGLSLAAIPEMAALDAVREVPGRVCPPCGAGRSLDGQGECVREVPIQPPAVRPAPKPRPAQTAPRPAHRQASRESAEPVRRAKPVVKPASGGRCFNFNGERFCN